MQSCYLHPVAKADLFTRQNGEKRCASFATPVESFVRYRLYRLVVSADAERSGRALLQYKYLLVAQSEHRSPISSII
jgi:hypothetical protein